jgi:RNA polymerase sigma factor (sigma-70 family)
MNRVLRHLPLPDGGALTDGQLLECFLSRRDEAAFAALVRRHGPMVLGVCRRVLGNRHDAEDAFQAAFLVLVRKAASLRSRELLGNWLYGVAYRTALKARVMTVRRQARERQASIPAATLPTGEHREELLALLDRELSRLPEKYRAAVILCELEGKSRKEAAALLRVPEGTLSSRLAQARKMLARRLLPAGVSLAVLGGASVCLPAGLQASTARAALLTGGQAVAGIVPAEVAALTEGVLKTMMLAQFKTVTAVVVGLAVLGLGTGGLVYRTRAVAAEPLQAQSPGGDRAKTPAQRQADEVEQARREAQAERDLAEKARQDAEAALRDARQKAEALAAEAVKERERAEAARQEALAQQDARIKAEAEVLAGRKLKGKVKAGGKSDSLDDDRSATELERELKRVLQKQTELTKELEALEAQKRELQFLLVAKKNEVQKKLAPDRQGDKLDQILQRLDRMDRRLQRLEQKK